MTRRARSRRARCTTLLRALSACVALVLVGACDTGSPGGTDTVPPARAADPVSAPTMQPDDEVDLTVYFRVGEGAAAHLAPVTKGTKITEDLPLTALGLLIAGPWSVHGDLRPLLPASTSVRSLRVEGDTAHVDLSREVLSDAAAVDPQPAHEVLALAAIAATLTEFPAIERVRLSVEGRQRGVLPGTGADIGAFWGGWGLPEVLVRDDSVLAEPARGEGVPPLEGFTLGEQRLGVAGEDEGVAVTGVRVRDRTTYLRLVVEVTDPADPDMDVDVPPVTARPIDGGVVLEIDGVAAYDADVAPGQRIELDDPGFGGLVVDDLGGGRVRAVVNAPRTRGLWLHRLANPTRIVLDVRK